MPPDFKQDSLRMLHIETTRTFEYASLAYAVDDFKKMSKEDRRFFVFNYFVLLSDKDKQQILINLTGEGDTLQYLVKLRNEAVQEYHKKVNDHLAAYKIHLEQRNAYDRENKRKDAELFEYKEAKAREKQQQLGNDIDDTDNME